MLFHDSTFSWRLTMQIKLSFELVRHRRPRATHNILHNTFAKCEPWHPTFAYTITQICVHERSTILFMNPLQHHFRINLIRRRVGRRRQQQRQTHHCPESTSKMQTNNRKRDRLSLYAQMCAHEKSLCARLPYANPSTLLNRKTCLWIIKAPTICIRSHHTQSSQADSSDETSLSLCNPGARWVRVDASFTNIECNILTSNFHYSLHIPCIFHAHMNAASTDKC